MVYGNNCHQPTTTTPKHRPDTHHHQTTNCSYSIVVVVVFSSCDVNWSVVGMSAMSDNVDVFFFCENLPTLVLSFSA